jgi:hypothetical protein
MTCYHDDGTNHSTDVGCVVDLGDGEVYTHGLSLRLFLNCVAVHGTTACAYLIEDGYPHKVVRAKAEKAARRGYVDYGTSPTACWITDKGREYLQREQGPRRLSDLVATVET